MAKGLLAILAPAMKGKGPGAPSDKEEASEPAPDAEHGSAEVDQYKSLIADSAKSGDWDAFADAVAGLVECSK